MHRLRRLVTIFVLALGALLAVWFAVWLLVAVFTASPGIDNDETLAMLHCQQLAYAANAYLNHPANPDHKLPTSIGDLTHPPWGGPSLYKGVAEKPLDPWGGSFRMEQRQMTDGTPCVIFWTVKPDGTRISQFGIGRLAEPGW
jgi:hypothetical protein